VLEVVAHNDDDQVVQRVGLCFHRAAPVVLALDLDDAIEIATTNVRP
jgi:hypothetical protein